MMNRRVEFFRTLPLGRLLYMTVAGLLLPGLAASPALAQRGGGHGGGFARGGGGYGRGYYGGGHVRGGWGWGFGWGGYPYSPYYGYPGYYGYYYPPYPLGAYTYGAPPPVAPAATVPNPLPRSFDLSVDFETGSAVLTPEATQVLNQLGQELTGPQVAADKFRIEGHTDTVGNRDYNLTLSQQRADAVAAYLESKFNIPPSRLEAIGVGENDLMIPTPDQTPEVRNRRVHVVNLSA